jgi:hypothetical protein
MRKSSAAPAHARTRCNFVELQIDRFAEPEQATAYRNGSE